MSWAVIAQSAIFGMGGTILSASEDICSHIAKGNEAISELMIFPDKFSDYGIYLWKGRFDQALSGEGVTHEELNYEQLSDWMQKCDQPDDNEELSA